ncbi:MAG: Hsp70 family protein, partial [Schleiferiaceae bacterium]|nr:Hsp70 family protein [Schleiferiaceae bacterium]
IPPAQRGTPQVEVTFDIDANGILNVSAKDKTTGKEQSIRIEASSGLSDDDIQRMKQEAESNADSDKKAREEADKLNAADQMVFQTEKQIKEFGDKLGDKKEAIESALEELKKAYASKEISAIDAAMEAMNEAWKLASEEMAKAQQETAAEAGNEGDTAPEAADDVTDVEFEEVK